MQQTIKIIDAAADAAEVKGAQVLQLQNDADPLEAALEGIERIELVFPKFTDGRAYSQVALLRRRRGFKGDIRATGDVLVDQLVHMQRQGFSSAVLRADKDVADVARQFERFPEFYQGDTVQPEPHFARTAA